MLMVMERSEPVLVPEWLKSSGSITGGGSINDQNSSPLRLDHHASKLARNKSSVSNGRDIGRTVVPDRITSSYLHRSSSSCSALSRSFSSSSRGRRVKDWDDVRTYHDRDKSVLADRRNHTYSDPLSTILPGRFDNDILRRSQPANSGERADSLPRKVAGDLTNANKRNLSNGNSLLAGASTVGSTHKSSFGHDFPLLGSEEGLGGSEIRRVSSPGLSASIQNLPAGSASMIGSDSWTSVLAEVPVVMGISGTDVASVQTGSTSLVILAPSVTSGLNMAETLAQGPSRAQTPPQSTVGTQRLEELAIRQSRQLIPMTPSLPRNMGVNASEKLKPKTGQHQLHSASLNHMRGGGPARPDSPKTVSEGRLRILKPSRDLNGIPSTPKDSLSPTNGIKAVNSPHGVPLSTTESAPSRSSGSNSNFASADRNPAPFRVTVEKRQTSQAQSRNDFFNLLKQKSCTSSPCGDPDLCSAVSPHVSKKSYESVKEVATARGQHGDAPSLEIPFAEVPTDNKGEETENSNYCDVSETCHGNRDKQSSPGLTLYPDEEEAFLRSLGWEESSGEDEGLKEEEINAFIEEYMKLRTSSKLLKGMQLAAGLNSYNGSIGGASSGSSLSDSGSES